MAATRPRTLLLHERDDWFTLEVTELDSDNAIDRQTFDFLARAAGLNLEDPHMDELFPYVQIALAANEGLKHIDITGFEPDASFDPDHYYQI